MNSDKKYNDFIEAVSKNLVDLTKKEDEDNKSEKISLPEPQQVFETKEKDGLPYSTGKQIDQFDRLGVDAIEKCEQCPIERISMLKDLNRKRMDGNILSKKDSDIKGVHPEHSSAVDQGQSTMGQYIRSAKSAKSKGAYNHANSFKQDAKRHASKVLEEIKSMPKPDLGKSDKDSADKRIKGLEQGQNMDAKSFEGKKKTVQDLIEEKEGKKVDKKMQKADPRNQSFAQSQGLKIAQPKPPKANEKVIANTKAVEKDPVKKAEIDNSIDMQDNDLALSEKKLGHQLKGFLAKKKGEKESFNNIKDIKGVHKPLTDKEGRYYNTDKGRSMAGSNASLSTAYKQGKVYHGSTMNPVKGKKANEYSESKKEEAIKGHTKVLEEIQSMPKPKLPK